MSGLATLKPATMQEFWTAGEKLKSRYEEIGRANTPQGGWRIPERKAIEAVKSMEAALDADLPALAAKMLLAEQIEQTWTEFPGYNSLKEVVEGELSRMTYTAFNCLLNLRKVIIPGLEKLGIDPLSYLASIKESNWFEIIPALRYLMGLDSDNRPISPATQNVVNSFLEEARQIAPGDTYEAATRAVTERLLDAAQNTNASLRRTLRPSSDMEFWLVDGRFIIAELKGEYEVNTFKRHTNGWSEIRQVGSSEMDTVPVIQNLKNAPFTEAEYAD